jgi:hypothetical protein
MSALEKMGITQKTTRVAVNYDKLGISTISIALNVPQKNQNPMISQLKLFSRVKEIYKTYGSHNIVLVLRCDRGEEGRTINNVKDLLERFAVTDIDVSVWFECEKNDTTPFAQESYLGTEVEMQPHENAFIDL